MDTLTISKMDFVKYAIIHVEPVKTIRLAYHVQSVKKLILKLFFRIP